MSENTLKRTLLYGAIIGDVVGSRYEGSQNAIKTKDFELFGEGCHFTDDTVMTIAVADALLKSFSIVYDLSVEDVLVDSMKHWGNKYPYAGYGGRFSAWLEDYEPPRPYYSYGNGAAMRVSPVALFGLVYNDLDFVRRVARWTAEVTHDHPEGVKGAESVAAAIFLAQHGASKSKIKSYVEHEFGYNLSRTVDEIRPTYRTHVEAQLSVPEAIIAFLDAENFEDTICNAVSLGGDADTQAAIAGSIAEAFFGVPDELITKVREKIPVDMLPVIDEFNHIVNIQKDVDEFDGNKELDSALIKFRANPWYVTEETVLLNMIRQRLLNDDVYFLIALEKIAESDDDEKNFIPLTLEEDGNNFCVAFTNAFELCKLFLDAGHPFKVQTAKMSSLLQCCADITAGGEPIGVAINPYSGQRYMLTPQTIGDLLTGDGLTEKSLMYKRLVERVQDLYPVYFTDDVKPTDDDKQYTRDFAATFDSKQKFWDALKSKGITWNENANPRINDMWAKNALSKAIACGFDPNAEVNLFAPTIDGVNICNEVNLYTYWQGFGYAKKTPRIKYLLVAQDWGNFFNAPDEFKSAVVKMNAGENIFYPFSLKSPTDKNLIELFKVLGRDVTKPCEDVFFTNFCLGYRFGKDSGGMTKELMIRDADLFRELCEILEPENILCLGRLTSECAFEALTGGEFKDVLDDAKSYNDFLDGRQVFLLPYGENKIVLSNFYPLAHCGSLGVKNRSFDKQREDWQAIADEMRLDEAIENFCRTNAPEDEQRVLDEIFLRLQTSCPFSVPLKDGGDATSLDQYISLFQNTKSVFIRQNDGKNFLAAFTSLFEFAKFNEENKRAFGLLGVSTEKLLTDCLNGDDGIILNPNTEKQFCLTRDMAETLLNRYTEHD